MHEDPDSLCGQVEVRVGNGAELDGSEYAHQVVRQQEQVCEPHSPKQQQPSADSTGATVSCKIILTDKSFAALSAGYLTPS